MTFAEDIADDLDYAIGDFSTTVQHVSVLTSGDRTSASFAALRRAVNRNDLAANPILVATDGTVFHLKQEDVTYQPKQNDKIIETVSGNVWTVLSVPEQTLSTRFRCVCRKDRS